MTNVRDYLLPGAFCFGFSVEDNATGGIDVIGSRGSRREVLSKDEITDGSYKMKFAPRLQSLKEKEHFDE